MSVRFSGSLEEEKRTVCGLKSCCRIAETHKSVTQAKAKGTQCVNVIL